MEKGSLGMRHLWEDTENWKSYFESEPSSTSYDDVPRKKLESYAFSKLLTQHPLVLFLE
jgi:hypothetical protein